MSDLNKAMLIGRLGKEPELSYTTSGLAVCKFSIATGEKWKDKDGNKQERTVWHNIVAWQKLAEIVAEYLHKGSQVYIEGRIDNRSYEKDGSKRYVSEVVAEKMIMLGGKKDGGSQGSDAPNPEPPPNELQKEKDDLPF